MGKVLNAVVIGYKLLAGVSVGYFVLKATDKKADELVEEGGMVNAAAVGLGQGALAAAAATVVYSVL
jgi:hypothetical protein